METLQFIEDIKFSSLGLKCCLNETCVMNNSTGYAENMEADSWLAESGGVALPLVCINRDLAHDLSGIFPN